MRWMSREKYRLPPLLCGYQCPVGGMREHKNGTYIVVVMGDLMTDDKFSLQLYDSTLGTWIIVTELSCIVVLARTMGPNMVFLDHFLYTLSNTDMCDEGNVCFDFKSRTLSFEEFQLSRDAYKHWLCTPPFPTILWVTSPIGGGHILGELESFWGNHHMGVEEKGGGGGRVHCIFFIIIMGGDCKIASNWSPTC